MSLTRGERVCAFVERYCKVPEGPKVGRPIKLIEFQRKFILAIYDAPRRVRRAYLSIARKNGKSALIAAILLAHIVGPEAVQNSQIISGARSRDQAALVFKLAAKMIGLNEELQKLARIIPSQKSIIGLARNVEYRAISAEAGTAHGLSPVLAILDEVGQVKGEQDDFIEAIETAQGAYDDPLLVAISTQAATDADLFSQWLDDADKDDSIVCHSYTAPDDCDLLDEDAWRAANPAMGEFRSYEDLKAFAEQAKRMPSKENSFRWLYLNQRIDATSPFVSRSVWAENGGDPGLMDGPIYGGLDLSEVADLTAFVAVSEIENGYGVHPTFWLPGDGLREKARADRVPYDRFAADGFLNVAPGRTVDYAFVADWMHGLCSNYDVRRINFDRWNYRHLRPWLEKSGFRDDQLEGDDAIFREFGQGFASMSPALRDMEAMLLEGRLAHGAHPVLEMCARNAVVQSDPAGNRKLVKNKSRGRIDGMIALTMALAAAVDAGNGPSVYEDRGMLMI